MDDDFDIDDDLLQAVDSYERSYKSQAGGNPTQQQQAAPAAATLERQTAEHPQRAPAAQAPIQQRRRTRQPGDSNTPGAPWQLFCSSVPEISSSCTGWAAKAAKAARHLQLQPKPRQAPPAAGQQQQQQQHDSNRNLPGMQAQQQMHRQQPAQHAGQQQMHQYQQAPQHLEQQRPWPSGPGQHVHGQVQGQWGQQQQQQQVFHRLQPQPQAQQQRQQQQQQQQQLQHRQQQHCQQPALSNSTISTQHAAAADFGQQHSSTAVQQQGPGYSVGINESGTCQAAAAASGSFLDIRQTEAGSGPGATVCGAGSSAPRSGISPAGAASGAGGGVSAAGSGGGAAASGGPSVLVSARLGLGAKGMIEVEFSSDHPAVADACGSILGAQRGPTHGWKASWLVPPDKVQQLEKTLLGLPAEVVRVAKFAPLPEFVCKILSTARKQPDDSALYECLSKMQLAAGETLEQRMMPFQREGVRFGLKVGGRLLIGDEMGLGKTVQACALALCYKAEWPVLVITPSSLRLSWAAALFDWIRVTDDRVLVVLKKTDMLPVANAEGADEARGMYDFVVVSYDMLKDCEDLLKALCFKVVICDESHCIKNTKAGRTQRALSLIEQADRAILLSGTPALSRPTELFTQLKSLLPRARIGKMAFEERYADTRQYGTFKKVVGSKNEDELNKLLTSTVMIRRRKADVLKDLPPKLRKQVLLMLPNDARNKLQKLKQQLQDVRKATANMHGVGKAVGGSLLQGMEQEQHNIIMNLYHETAKIKADAVAQYVAEMVEDMSDEDDKFLVFAYHRELMDAIERGVNHVKQKNKEYKGLKYMRIDGSTPARQREANVNTFQSDADCRVAILNIKAAGVGLTLTRASTVVFAELAWTPSEVQQAEDRAHRIGQSNCVSVQLLIVKDSIDELMWDMLQNKLAMTGQVLDGQAERMQVDKAAVAHRPQGTGANWQRESTQEDNQQKSITSFFAPSSTAAGDTTKRQRLN